VKLREAAYLLSCSPSTLRRAIRRGELKARRWMRHIVISQDEIERFASDEATSEGEKIV
jgi:excisionase family DNA binding protein